MLDFLKISSIDELFEDIPAELRLKGELNIPEADPEPLLLKKMNQLAAQKHKCKSISNFSWCGYV